jgi:hypothetical protein
MHLDEQTRLRLDKACVGGTEGKTVAMGLLERHGHARVRVIPNWRIPRSPKRHRERPGGFDRVQRCAALLSQSSGGQIRSKGTYLSVEPFHLQAYADEQCFRFNERKSSDVERFALVMMPVVGRRTTYWELTGKFIETEPG